MRSIVAVVLLFVATRAAAAQPTNEDFHTFEGGARLSAMVAGYNYSDANTQTGVGLFGELEGEVRNRGYGLALAVGVVAISTLNQSDDRAALFDFAARVRFHSGNGFWGVGGLLWVSIGGQNYQSSVPTDHPMPLAEIHGGYTWRSNKNVAPQLFIAVAGGMNASGAVLGYVSVGGGVQF
jgi:hypothetical protein